MTAVAKPATLTVAPIQTGAIVAGRDRMVVWSLSAGVGTSGSAGGGATGVGAGSPPGTGTGTGTTAAPPFPSFTITVCPAATVTDVVSVPPFTVCVPGSTS